jgi:hypothetical protein
LSLLRVRIETGATFKHAKELIKKRPWDPAANNQEDSMYWLKGEQFVKLDTQAWADIAAGRPRL